MIIRRKFLKKLITNRLLCIWSKLVFSIEPNLLLSYNLNTRILIDTIFTILVIKPIIVLHYTYIIILGFELQQTPPNRKITPIQYTFEYL